MDEMKKKREQNVFSWFLTMWKTHPLFRDRKSVV